MIFFFIRHLTIMLKFVLCIFFFKLKFTELHEQDIKLVFRSWSSVDFKWYFCSFFFRFYPRRDIIQGSGLLL